MSIYELNTKINEDFIIKLPDDMRILVNHSVKLILIDLEFEKENSWKNKARGFLKNTGLSTSKYIEQKIIEKELE